MRAFKFFIERVPFYVDITDMAADRPFAHRQRKGREYKFNFHFFFFNFFCEPSANLPGMLSVIRSLKEEKI